MRSTDGPPDVAGAPYMNPYLAGIGLGFVLLSAFVLMGRGLGASGAFNSTLAWLLSSAAPEHTAGLEYLGRYLGDGTTHPMQTWLVYEVAGVFVGALVSGLLAGRVRFGIDKGPSAPTSARLVAAFGGGTLTAAGANLARGCTSGQALTGGALLNAGSWVFMLSVFAGAYAVARLVRWQWR